MNMILLGILVLLVGCIDQQLSVKEVLNNPNKILDCESKMEVSGSDIILDELTINFKWNLDNLTVIIRGNKFGFNLFEFETISKDDKIIETYINVPYMNITRQKIGNESLYQEASLTIFNYNFFKSLIEQSPTTQEIEQILIQEIKKFINNELKQFTGNSNLVINLKSTKCQVK